MKKIISLLLVGLMSFGLWGCGDSKAKKDTTTSTKQETKKEQKKEPTREELNEKLKKEAVEADFVKINAGEAKGMKVFAEGKISAVDNESKLDIFPSFMLSHKKNNGYGVYHVRNVLSVQGLKDGDTVKIYGTVDDPDKKNSMPTISATIIEKAGNVSSSETKTDKESIKREIAKVLSDKNVASIDVLTLKDGKFKAAVQLKGDVLKKDVSKEDAIQFCKTIGEKIKPICSEYDIELIDKNSQLVILFDQDGKTN